MKGDRHEKRIHRLRLGCGVKYPRDFMHILLAHNRFRQTGGEDSAYAMEHSLLLQHGHIVTEFLEDNRRIGTMNRLALAIQAVWSSSSHKQLSTLLKNDQPEVAYFFNTFPLISPSAYYACKEQSVPVVQGLHNYRFLCPSADFFTRQPRMPRLPWQDPALARCGA